MSKPFSLFSVAVVKLELYFVDLDILVLICMHTQVVVA